MKAFVSYAESDRAVAERIQSHLAAEGFKVWQDEEVLPGQNWALAVGQALEKSDALIVLLSPSGLTSRKVRREIDYALTQKRFQNRLIPVVVKPTRGIPWILEQCSLVAWREDPESALDRIAERLRKPVRLPTWQRGSARARELREPVRVAD